MLGFSDLCDLPNGVVQPRRKSSASEDGEKVVQAAGEWVEKWTLGRPNPFLTLNGLVPIRISRLNPSKMSRRLFPGLVLGNHTDFVYPIDFLLNIERLCE